MRKEDLQKLGSPDKESRIGNDVTDHDFQVLLKEIEQACVVFPKKTPKPFILIPTGLTASGKSTIVKQIAEHYSLVIIRTDSIRSYLEGRGFNLVRTVEFAYDLVMNSLKRGYGVAIDADVVQEKDRDVMRKVAREFGIPLISIKVVTPENVILSRLDEKNLDRDYRGREAIKRYFERKPLHSDHDLDHDFKFNGNSDLAPQLIMAFERINERLTEES